ncbi:MAG: Hsp20/alpha crystallin family protein [Chloroflexota bacterium]
MDKGKEEFDPTEVLSGTLDIFGFKVDLGKLLASEEALESRLGDLRERLKKAGGREVLSDEEWNQKAASVTGYIRTRGPLGEREFHVGTSGKPRRSGSGQMKPTAPEVMEPPVDVFDEGQQVTIVADVPGTTLDDLELKVEGRTLSLSTKPAARRSYRRELRLQSDVDPGSLRSSCRNGVLEVHIRKRQKGAGPPSQSSEKKRQGKRKAGA